MKEFLPNIFRVILILGLLVLLVRIIDVSLIRGHYYQSLAKENRIRRIPIIAPRGTIYDRNGISLTENQETSRVVRFEEGKALYFVEPGQVNRGDVVVPWPQRSYPEASSSAHVVGFLAETDPVEVEQKGCPNSIFHIGDRIGRMGAESTFDCRLRGKDGEELVEVDTRGKKIRVLGKVRPTSGEDVILSIDSKLQERAIWALGARRGAVVALDARNGEILALVSSPSFDPNTVSSDYQELSKNPELPLFNRAIGGAYPPGSTFKIVVAAAALEEKTIDENFRFTDPGVIKLGAEEFTNWLFTKRGRTEGELDVVRAITRSTDTFFYKLGEMVGASELALWANKFGLGERTGINLSGETQGVIPTPVWKERVRGERWFLGNTYNVAIGQGDITASPLQVAVMTSVIASGGRLCVPTVRRVEDGGWKMENCREIGLSQKTLDLIKQGMVGACSPGGTAWPLFNFKVKDPHEPESVPAKQIQVACKTGTAEFGVKDENGKTKTHAWLTAYAPSDNPEIVVTALVEGGGEGSDVAAPIVKEILGEWFVK